MTWTIQDEQQLAALERETADLTEKRTKHEIAKREVIGQALGVPMVDNLVGIVLQYEKPIRDALNALHDARLVPGGKVGAGDMIASLDREQNEVNKRIALAVIAWAMPPDLNNKRVQVARCIIDHANELGEILK